MTDFEEVNFLSGDEDNDLFDGYEEVEIPGGDDSLYGTKLCICKCHIDTTCMEYKEKRKHCISCGIKVIRGRLYLQSDKKLRPLHIKFNQPVKMPAHLENENLSEEEELEEGDEEELSLSEVEEGDIEGDKVIEQEALEEDDDDIDDKVIEQDGMDDDEDDVDDKGIVVQEAIIDDEEDIDEKGAEIEDDEDENDDINNESESGEENQDQNEDENDDINNDSESDENNDESEYVEEDDIENMEVNFSNLDNEVNDVVEPKEQSSSIVQNGIGSGLDKIKDACMGDKENNLSEDEKVYDDTELEETGSDPDGDVIEEGDGEDVEDLDPDSNEVQNGMSEKEYSAESCEEKEEGQSDQESGSFIPAQKCVEENTLSPTFGPTDFSSLRSEIEQSKTSIDGITLDIFPVGDVGISSSSTNSKCDTLVSDSSTKESSSKSDSIGTEIKIGLQSDSKEVTTIKSVEKPIMVEENASFNLVTNKLEEAVQIFRPAALTCEELLGSISDTEDNTNFPVRLQKPGEDNESTQEQFDSSTTEDVSSQEHHSGTVMLQEDDSVKWTMDDDKLILEMVKVNGANNIIFDKIAKKLRDKTKEQVETRFKTLLAVLSDENDSDEQTDEEDDS